MKTHRLIVAAAAVAATAIALTGCSAAAGGGGNGGGSNKSPIIIGFNDGLSGDNAATGQIQLKLANAVADYTNKTGGIDGRKVQIKALDAGDIGSGKASANAIQLTQQGAVAILGPDTDGDCAAVYPIVNKAKVPELCNFATGDQITGADKYVFSSNGTNYGSLKPQIEFLKQQTGKAKPRIALLADPVPGTQLQLKKIEAVADSYGIDVVYSDFMSGSATSVDSYVAAIAASKPDGLWLQVFPQYTVPAVRGIRASGLDIPIVSTVGVGTYPFQASAKDPKWFASTGGSYIFPDKSSNSPEVKKLVASLKKAGLSTVEEINDNDFPTHVLSMLDFMDSLKKCGANCTGAQLQKKLFTNKFSFPGLVKDFQFQPDRHDGNNTLQFWGWDAASDTSKYYTTLDMGSTSATQP